MASQFTKIPNKSPFSERELCILSTREFYKQVRGDAKWSTTLSAQYTLKAFLAGLLRTLLLFELEAARFQDFTLIIGGENADVRITSGRSRRFERGQIVVWASVLRIKSVH